MKRGRLSNKILIFCGIFAAALILCTCLAVGKLYWEKKMDEYSALAFSYARTAAQYIDGDRVAGYVETGEKDAYYQQVMDFLNATQMQTDLKYYCVIIPYENDLVYVWDADSVEGACPLGYREEYMEGGKETLDKAYCQNPPEEIWIVDDEDYGYIASAYSPIFDSSGQPVALVGVDLPMPEMQKTMLQFISVIILCIAAATVILAAVFSIYIRRKVASPIALLNTVTREMVSHLEQETDFEVQIHTGDEIEELADSFGQMTREVRDYIRRLETVTAEKERIGAELSVATQIQADMLPRIFPAFPKRDEFDIYATMTPAKEVGGDFYDFFMVDDDHLMLVIADVSGKGVPAALFMVIAKTLLKNSAEQGLSPKEVFEKVNNQLCENNDEGMFVTVWMGLLEISTGKLICANAGHDDPIVIRNGKAEIIRQRHGLLMAQMEGIPYREQEIMLQPGDTIFVYTDGVSEATSAANELYGKDRILAALDRAAGKTPEEILAAVKEDVDAFVGDAPQFDDITMLSVKMSEKTAPSLSELKTEPTVDNLYQVTGFVEDTLGELGVPMKTLMRINVALDEIFSNIAHYSGASECTVACGVQGNRAIVRFADNGTPYDPTARPEMDTTLSLDERGEGGMGIHMVRKTMDTVRYEYKDGKNMLTLEKAW